MYQANAFSLSSIETNIEGFMRYYRTHFPEASILTMLEAHVPGRVEKWGVDLGLVGEHGTESIHTSTLRGPT